MLGGWLRARPSSLVALSIVVGVLTGLGAVIFRYLISGFTWLFTGHQDFAGLGRISSTHLPWLGACFLLVVPVVAGLIYGPLVYRFAPEARGHGVPEVMYAVSMRGGRIAPRVAFVKSLASALCIGGGGSVGREGPIVQIGSAVGSSVAQWLRLDTTRVRLLVACGAAGGISATFNTPLAGPFFAMELILKDFAAQSFGAVVLSSVTASIVGRALLGDQPFLKLPSFSVHSPAEYLLFAALGVLVGVVGVVFAKVLYLVEDACDWLWRGPEWARPAVGGVLLGALLLALPEMYGVGYPVLQKAIEGRYVVGFLLVLMIGKMLATSLTIGIGGSGGVFAPTLFIGAMAGSAFGVLAHMTWPSATEAAGAYGLVGMGAALAGATRASITAVIILFELTGQYSIILPLMIAVALAAGTSHLLSRQTIYTSKLWRRGIDLENAPALPDNVTAAALAAPPPVRLPEHMALADAAELLARAPTGMVPVVADGDRYVGCVSAEDAVTALEDTEGPQLMDSLLRQPPTIPADAQLPDVVKALSGYGATGLPVVDEGSRLVGWITYENVLTRLTVRGHQ
ncbi:chloride channel protein EriC [Mycolicibacterium chubuense NBB4]|uniref:Chloride channel protein EriC n=2 Tax=Mycolicibacterium chubuense TaxID=1800 RepID=I4BIP3_MYCCN|nr:chloride channel protein EriC [Mycolicibacterium chubuense NBB4]